MVASYSSPRQVDNPGVRAPGQLKRLDETKHSSWVFPHRILFLLFAAIIALGLRPRSVAGSSQAPTLNAVLRYRALFVRGIPLTEALRTIGADVEKGYISFGVEVYVTAGKEPVVDLDVPPGASVDDVRRQLSRQLPQYEFDIVSPHLVSVCPKVAMRDPKDPLNIRVLRFDANGEAAGAILTWPERFIPELRQRTGSQGGADNKHIDLYVGPVAVGTAVKLSLRNVTVRQILCAVSEATEDTGPKDVPLGWEYSFDPQMMFKPGAVQSWRLLMTFPHNWAEQVREGPDKVP